MDDGMRDDPGRERLDEITEDLEGVAELMGGKLHGAVVVVAAEMPDGTIKAMVNGGVRDDCEPGAENLLTLEVLQNALVAFGEAAGVPVTFIAAGRIGHG